MRFYIFVLCYISFSFFNIMNHAIIPYDRSYKYGGFRTFEIYSKLIYIFVQWTLVIGRYRSDKIFLIVMFQISFRIYNFFFLWYDDLKNRVFIFIYIELERMKKIERINLSLQWDT